LIDLIKKIAFLGLFKKTYSQDKEDLFLINYFKGLNKGYYVDIGCHHPKRFSNTYLLYKKGWNGLNVDANKLAIILFKIFRFRDENVCAILSDSSKPAVFYEFNESALNGMLSSQRVKKLLNLGFTIKKKKTTIPISVQNFIKQNRLKERKINFFKIDIEGLDFEVIKKMNLKNLDIELLMIEKSIKQENDKMIQWLKSQFYSIIHESNRNYIFKKNE
jgi:hypothetical protein